MPKQLSEDTRAVRVRKPAASILSNKLGLINFPKVLSMYADILSRSLTQAPACNTQAPINQVFSNGH